MLDAVVFDWSGTISDDRLPVYNANIRIMEMHGKKALPYKEWLVNVVLSAQEFFASQGIVGSAEELLALYTKVYGEIIREGLVPVPYHDAKETLAELRELGLRLAVVSSHPQTHLHHEAQRYELDHFFHQVVGSSHNKVVSLTQLVQEFAWNPSRVLYVGDTVFDIRSAKEAGIKSAGVTTGYHTKERLKAESPDFLFSSLSELYASIRPALEVPLS